MTTGETLCILVHGDGGVGKSWLGQTSPEPRLVLDAEGGSRSPKRMVDGTVVRQKMVDWNPTTSPPPTPDGTWQTCHVKVVDFNTISRAFEWLNTGNHGFRSVVIDSLTEIQKRCKDAISGTETPSERDWGILLLRMEHLVRSFRDLVFHPSHPLEAVVILALTMDKNGYRTPAVQGALGVSLPGYVDVEGYMFVAVDEETLVEERKLLIVPREGFKAKDRTHTLSSPPPVGFGPAIASPDIEKMLAALNADKEK